MSGANASPIGRSHQVMSGANASPIGRSDQVMSGANASPIGRSDQVMIAATGPKRNESGVGMIEMMIASLILAIASLSILGLISVSIVTNNRNKMDSTGTMLAQSVIEQVKATLIGTGNASLTDCDGTDWAIETSTGGAALTGVSIDFTEASPPADYYMNYVMRSPCTTTGAEGITYDVRWRVEVVGASAGTPTNTYAIYLGARKQNHSEGNMFYSLPVNFRVLVGN
jgi:Flp pilus assembly protein TadG